MKKPADLDLKLVAEVVALGLDRTLSASEWFGHLCEELFVQGLPIARVHVTFVPQHPQLQVGVLKWLPGQAVSWGHVSWPERNVRSPVFRRNPIYQLREGRITELRTRLDDAARASRYRLTQELAKEGMTDYLAIAVDSGLPTFNTIAFISDRPGGFEEYECEQLRSVAWALQLVMQRDTWRTLSDTICQTYIGKRAGQRVFDGDMRRGQYTRMDAVVWFCDVRDFSLLFEHSEPDDVFGQLNVFFDTVGEAIEAHGGEILKFIGDGVLGIFPYEGEAGARAASHASYDAAIGCLEALDQVNRKRLRDNLSNIRCGIGLHRGEVLYGNIGTQMRLDFTVMGQTVNTTSRVESLCARLNEPLLITDAVAQHLDERVRALGEFEVKGLSQPCRIFALPENRQYEASKAPQPIDVIELD